MFKKLFGFLITAFAVVAVSAFADPPPIDVMIVGDYHMSNPDKDLHNISADDVLAPRRQSELAAVAKQLSGFRPTKVMVEWPADLARDRYHQYLAGTLAPSHNEVVQLGFRLAKQTGLQKVYGIDVDGDFPFDAVQSYAKAHKQQSVLDAANARIQQLVDAEQAKVRTGTVADVLRFLNDPARIVGDNGFYRDMLRIGSGTQQPGVALLTAWYQRNFAICANLLQRARPGDRIVVFYGAGHAFLLRQCVQETPGYRLIEPDSYLK